MLVMVVTTDGEGEKICIVVYNCLIYNISE